MKIDGCENLVSQLPWEFRAANISGLIVCCTWCISLCQWIQILPHLISIDGMDSLWRWLKSGGFEFDNFSHIFFTYWMLGAGLSCMYLGCICQATPIEWTDLTTLPNMLDLQSDSVMWYDLRDPHFREIIKIMPHDSIQLQVCSADLSDWSRSSGLGCQIQPFYANDVMYIHVRYRVTLHSWNLLLSTWLPSSGRA